MLVNLHGVQAENCVQGTGDSKVCTGSISGSYFEATITYTASGGGGYVNYAVVYDSAGRQAGTVISGPTGNVCNSGPVSQTWKLPVNDAYTYKIWRAWCVRPDACSGCGYDTVIMSGGPFRMTGCYSKNGSYAEFGSLTKDNFGHYYTDNGTKQTDADKSSGACTCIGGTSWSSNASCCGDDTADCGRVVLGELCNIDSLYTTTSWINSMPNKGDIRRVACSKKELLSDGITWKKCYGNFWNRTVNNHEYICPGTNQSFVAECCGEGPCNSLIDGIRLNTGQSINASYPRSYNYSLAYQSAIYGSYYNPISSFAVYDGMQSITGRQGDGGPDPRFCGDNNCEAGIFEDCASCPDDCGYCPSTAFAKTTCKNRVPVIVLDWNTCAALRNTPWLETQWKIFVSGELNNPAQGYVYNSEVQCKGSMNWSADVPRKIVNGPSPDPVPPENFHTYAWDVSFGIAPPQVSGTFATLDCTLFDGINETYDCGNKICETTKGENERNCPQDCGGGVNGTSCGNRICEKEKGENNENCEQDCPPVCPNGVCEPGENHNNCPADCEPTVKGTFYCTSDNKFAIDLDTPNSRINDTQLNIRNKKTCEAAGFKWTGTKCCSEADDPNEYYNDAGGTGGCWKKSLVISIDSVNNTNNSVGNYNGEFHGCAINESNFKVNDTHLLKIPDTHTRKPLIIDNSYCANDQNNNYYCSYTEKWILTNGADKSHLTYAPIDNPAQKAECCAADECWSGSSCVANQRNNSVSPPLPGTSYRCIDGNWVISTLKYTPDGTKSGYCPQEPQCLVDPFGKNGTANCIETGQYIDDDYCENGNWTSRTKLLALKMLKLGATDYILFCDNRENTLNNINYLVGSSKLASTVLTNIKTNNFCILIFGNDVIAGVTINQDIENISSTDLGIFGIADCNDALINDSQYHPCNNKNGSVWYNKNLRSLIYSQKAMYIPTDNGPLDLFEQLIGQPIKSVKDNIQILITTPPYDDSYVNSFKKLKRIYLAKQQKLTVISSIEGVQFRNLIVGYTDFDNDICNFVAQFNQAKKDAFSGVACGNANNNYYVLAQGSIFTSLNPESIWQDLTSKLRLK